MNAADVLVEELQTRGVPFIATLNGHGLDPLLLACKRAGMRMIDVRNEQAAGYMAEVTGRLTRSVGVCAVSGAVAHANALTGALNAWFDGAPMLLLTGMTPLERLGFGDFQDFNPVPMATPICKYARMLDAPHRTAQIVHEALAAATSGRPGPVHLSLPIDVMSAEVEQKDIPKSMVRSAEVPSGEAASEKTIHSIVQRIEEAERPVLVAGSGLYYARGEQALKTLSEHFEIPTVVPIWDRGSIDEPNPAFLGVIGAATGGARLLQDADLVILVGAEFDYRVGQLSPPVIREDAMIVRIHADAARLRQGLQAHLSVQASPATVLEQLAQACEAENVRSKNLWLSEARQRREDYRNQCLAVSQQLEGGMNGGEVVMAIHEVLTDDTLLLVDGGNIGQWFHQLLTDRYPGHWLTCGASGVVGWGLPGAMAAKAIHPDRPVILLSGDGSFTFTVAELECAARQGLNFVAVVADDQQWGISVTGHVERYGHPLFSELGPTRLDKVAQGFGCRGLKIDSIEQLVPELRTALTADQPTVIQVPLIPSSP